MQGLLTERTRLARREDLGGQPAFIALLHGVRVRLRSQRRVGQHQRHNRVSQQRAHTHLGAGNRASWQEIRLNRSVSALSDSALAAAITGASAAFVSALGSSCITNRSITGPASSLNFAAYR